MLKLVKDGVTLFEINPTTGALETVGGEPYAGPGEPAPGTFDITEVEVDFGYPPIRTKTFTVTDAAVSTNSRIIATQSGNIPTGKGSNESEMDPLVCSAIPGTGQFTLILSGIEGSVAGPFKVLYTVA